MTPFPFPNFLLLAFLPSTLACISSGIGGCNCRTNPGCGPCAPSPNPGAYSYSYDGGYNQQQQQQQQSVYQAPAAYVPPPPTAAYRPPPLNFISTPAPAPVVPWPDMGLGAGLVNGVPYAAGPEGNQVVEEVKEEEHYQPQPESRQYQSKSVGDTQDHEAAYAPRPTPRTPSGSNSRAQYPSQEYVAMLVPEVPSTPPPTPTTSTSAPAIVSQKTYQASFQSASVSTHNDQTAYREGYHEEEGEEATAHFASGSVIAPPPRPEDLATEEEEEETESAGPEEIPYASTPTPSAYASPTTTTTITAHATPTSAPAGEYAAVLKELTLQVPQASTPPLDASPKHVCTGVVVAKSLEASVAAAIHRCLELECGGVNVRQSKDARGASAFEAVFLHAVDDRKPNDDFDCFVVRHSPTTSTAASAEPSEGTTTSPFPLPFINVNRVSEKRRAPSSFRVLPSTFRPVKFRFATIEPKSAY